MPEQIFFLAKPQFILFKELIRGARESKEDRGN